MTNTTQRALLLMAWTAGAAACGDPLTEVVVFVNTEGLTIGTDVDAVRMSVTGPGGDSDERFRRDRLLLCAPGVPGDCFQLPITLTLIPGSDQPKDIVRVEVDGLRSDAKVIGDAAIFTFHHGASERLDFILYANCLNVDCTTQNEACDISGKCVPITPGPLNAGGDAMRGDFATPLSTDLAGFDLTGVPIEDMSMIESTDLAGLDLSGRDLRQPIDLAGSDLAGDLATLPLDMTHFQWVPMNSPVGLRLNSVWGTSATNVFAVGASGTILHYNGSGWGTETSTSGADLYAVWGDATSGDLYAAGVGTILHRIGVTWFNDNDGPWGSPLLGLGGNANDDKFVVGSGPAVIGQSKANAGGWSDFCPSVPVVLPQWDAVFTAGLGLYVAGTTNGVGAIYNIMNDLKMVHIPYTTPSAPPIDMAGPPLFDMSSGGMCSAAPLYVGGGTITSLAGNSTTLFATQVGGNVITCTLPASCGTAATIAPGQDLNGVWSNAAATVAYAVGTAATIKRFSGAWVSETVPPSVTADLFGVWSTPTGPAFAVGAAGTILMRP